jgi:hypothetical protein
MFLRAWIRLSNFHNAYDRPPSKTDRFLADIGSHSDSCLAERSKQRMFARPTSYILIDALT